MPWRNICPMEERDRFIEDWLEDELSMTGLCAHFGVSRKTGYKWIGRFREKGGLGLSDASRAPRTHPNATRAAMEARVLDFRQRHPLWGPRKLLERLQRIEPGVVWPASSTIGAILKRNGMVVGRKRRRRVQVYKGGLSEGNRPNDVWAADFKGWFRTGDGTRIDPLTVSDLASRYLLRVQSVRQSDMGGIRGHFTAAFREYGLPSVIRTDNGLPFASVGLAGLSRLNVWFVRLGIRPERIRPGHPGENGVHERMHRTLKDATANPPRGTPKLQQEAFDRFMSEFNDERPHESLAMRTPADVYEKSDRTFPERLVELKYPADMFIRKVFETGCIKVEGKLIRVSKSLHGEFVGLRHVDDGRTDIWFGPTKLGTYNARKRKVERA